MLGQLPTSLPVGDRVYPIRSDFRDILNILEAFADPDLDAQEKVYVCLFTIYPDLEHIPADDLQEAYEQAVQFIDCGAEAKPTRSPKIVDWAQDERLIFPAINKVAGTEVRALGYLHWWTFLGYFMEISEGTYSQILSMRSRKARGKKLEKYETEFWNANRDICVLQKRLSKEEQEEKERLNQMFK